MSKKERADILCVQQGLFDSREQAKRGIMAGIVYNKNIQVDKPGEKIIVETSELRIKGQKMPYVSRGGYKLAKALTTFELNIKDKIMLDIGSSTGGFTDCALQNGIKMSYALDVGTNQLAWKIRNDERVVVMEQTNFRYATPEMFAEGLPQFVSIDVSFISLKLILPNLAKILVENGEVIALIKPQFEAGKENVEKGGIVKNNKVHQKVLTDIIEFANDIGFILQGLTYSPITGGDGNIEFLAYFNKSTVVQNDKIDWGDLIHRVVNEAHQQLKL